MSLHKRIPLDCHRRAELFFSTVHKLGSSESDTICNPSIPPLHSKLGFLSFITESLYRGTTLHGGEGIEGELKFSLLKSAKRHKGSSRQSFSDS